MAAIEDRLKRVGLRLNRDNHEGGRLLQGRSAAARRRAFRRNMISGQMRRWRRLHRRIGLTQTFLLQAHVGTTETHSGLPVHHRWRPVVVDVKPAQHPSDPTTAFTFVGAAISEICGSCKETPRSDYSSFLLCGVSHIMGETTARGGPSKCSRHNRRRVKIACWPSALEPSCPPKAPSHETIHRFRVEPADVGVVGCRRRRQTTRMDRQGCLRRRRTVEWPLLRHRLRRQLSPRPAHRRR